MKIHFICGYHADKARRQQGRPEPYWDAVNYVWAVKVGSFKHPFKVHGRSGPPLSITADNFRNIRPWFGQFIEEQIKAERWENGVKIVPIPSKDCIVGSMTSRSSLMARECLASTSLNGAVTDALRWVRAFPKAHQGGDRSQAFFLGNVHVDPAIAGSNVVLVDDLMTTGASLLAAKTLLERSGARVLGAVVCGRTIYDLKTPNFARQEYWLDREIAEA